MHNIYNTYIHTLCNILAILRLHEIASTLRYFSCSQESIMGSLQYCSLLVKPQDWLCPCRYRQVQWDMSTRYNPQVTTTCEISSLPLHTFKEAFQS